MSSRVHLGEGAILSRVNNLSGLQFHHGRIRHVLGTPDLFIGNPLSFLCTRSPEVVRSVDWDLGDDNACEGDHEACEGEVECPTPSAHSPAIRHVGIQARPL